ncbi:MAG: hydroxyacid dehydrogenase [Candidatus Lokiarchaeia archaeon]
MKQRVLVADKIHSDAINMMEDAGLDLVVNFEISREELKAQIPEFDAIIVRSRTKVTREIIEAGKGLVLIARSGVGLDNIDLEAAEERGIRVVNSPEASSVSVAELTLGAMISLMRNIHTADRSMKEGKWLKKELEGRELRGKTLGIIGLGRIGQEVARRAVVFQMRILSYDILEEISPEAERLGVEFVGTSREALEKLLRESDVITLHVPYQPETAHMIGAKEISLMKDGAYILNVARGGILDEKALYEALKSEKIAGAALDCYEQEPPNNLPLADLPNVLCTPHIGSATQEALIANSTIIAEKVIDFFKR